MTDTPVPARLLLALTSAVAFVAAAGVVVVANTYAWDLEATYVLGPDDDQSLYGVAFFVYGVFLVLPALVHLVSLVVHALVATQPRTPRSARGVAVVAWALGVLGYVPVCFYGLVFVLEGLAGPVPRQQYAAALALNALPLLVVLLPGLVRVAARRRARRQACGQARGQVSRAATPSSRSPRSATR